MAIPACPLVMFFVVRAMHSHRMQDPAKRDDESGQRPSCASAGTSTDNR
ncbi:MAG: hypothetical protein HYR50_08180 [Candidatus Rokubacteria bacterium]|nr:hypothetical protein [Candidatus Rokubacteria bacterium]